MSSEGIARGEQGGRTEPHGSKRSFFSARMIECRRGPPEPAQNSLEAA